MLYRDYRRIEGYEDYIISNYGEVISLKHGKSRIIKLQPTTKGYLGLSLYKDDKRTQRKIHILVGNAFIGERTGKLTFDHIDRDKTNNRADNIRLATPEEQAINKGIYKNNKLRLQNISIQKKSDTYSFYRINIKRNGKNFVKSLNIKKYTLEDAIKIRDVQMEKLKSNANENEID